MKLTRERFQELYDWYLTANIPDAKDVAMVAELLDFANDQTTDEKDTQ